MSREIQTGLTKRRLFGLCAGLLGGMAFANAGGAGQSSVADADALEKHGVAAPRSYRVINLRPPDENFIALRPVFNARDQVAFTTEGALVGHGWFYDGKSLVDIGSLNGGYTIVSGLNDAGQVAGSSFIRDIGGEGGSGEIFHAFVWSRARGMRDIGPLGGLEDLDARAINNKGQVVGMASTPGGGGRAFRWSASEGMLDLGLLSSDPNSTSAANAINDAGKVAGVAETADGNFHAFVWTRERGMADLGTLGGTTSIARAIGADGLVAGESTVHGSSLNHAFIWTRGSGMRDVGPRGLAEAGVEGMSSNGHMFGNIYPRHGGRHPFSWTRSRGMIHIGTLGGSDAMASAGNNRGQVVGGSMTTNDEDFHAFIWTAKEGIVDLNTRLRHAPAGLVLNDAVAISDNGFIVVDSNAGAVLLVPEGCPAGPHAVGPIAADDLVQVGRPFESSVSFSSEDATARHNILWNWGDGSGVQQGNARENDGAGVASATHVYAAPGIYTVSAKVGDRSGQGPTASRTVIVYDPAPGTLAGSGWFISPRGAHKTAGAPTGRAEFSFLFPSTASAKASKAAPRLNFSAGGMSFRSDNVRLVAMQGARVEFEGSGTLNGRSNYRFNLKTTAGTGKDGAGRFGLKVWHTDPVTRAPIVDYDNQDASSQGPGLSFHGKILAH